MESAINVSIIKGFSPCVMYEGYSLKGRVNTALDLYHLSKFLPIIKGDKELFNEIGVLAIQSNDFNINIFSDGSFFIRVKDKNYKIKKLLRSITGIIVKTHKCNGCGICMKICPEKIIKVEKNEINNHSFAILEMR